MALTYANRKQMSYARRMAWERGKTITNWPDTSSGLRVLIQKIGQLPALPITEDQEEQYTTLVAECVGKVENFQAERFSEVPVDRASANKAIYAMQGLLRAADARHTATLDVDAFLANADEDEASENAEAEAIGF